MCWWTRKKVNFWMKFVILVNYWLDLKLSISPENINFWLLFILDMISTFTSLGNWITLQSNVIAACHKSMFEHRFLLGWFVLYKTPQHKSLIGIYFCVVDFACSWVCLSSWHFSVECCFYFLVVCFWNLMLFCQPVVSAAVFCFWCIDWLDGKVYRRFQCLLSWLCTVRCCLDLVWSFESCKNYVKEFEMIKIISW